MDIEGSSPVGEHHLLCDEAVVASTPASLMGEIHRALIGPRGLIVMIQHRGMGGGSARERRRGRIERNENEKGVRADG